MLFPLPILRNDVRQDNAREITEVPEATTISRVVWVNIDHLMMACIRVAGGRAFLGPRKGEPQRDLTATSEVQLSHGESLQHRKLTV